jgi:hypothetical protein
MENPASGKSLHHVSFGFFLTILLTMRIAYHVLIPMEMKHWRFPVNCLQSFLSGLPENHGRPDADGGHTIISAKMLIHQKLDQVAAHSFILLA